MNIEIEYLKPQHLTYIDEIDKLCFHKPWSIDEFKKELENPIASYFVALCNEKVVAYGGFWWVMFEAEITNIAVHPDFRRNKIASRILDKMIEKCRETGTSKLHLEVREDNEKAISLYEKYGFKAVGLRKNYYSDNENAILMTKEIKLN